ncbi:MAG: hypothetical protein DRM99_04385 [Thermoplasmata archaeon]|nr:MAG: hypothetical protein DRM99_04385 [Thermoplasmata archaeon]
MKNRYRKILDSNDGVAGVVVALLMIGLIFSAIALVQTVFVPQWMEKKEAEHMEEIANQFSQLKLAVDLQSLSAQQNIPVSCPITLGSKEIPFLSSVRSYGTLNLISDGLKIEIKDNTRSPPVPYTLGSLQYSSENAYFLNQVYTYEGGALILNQTSNDIMIVDPAIYQDPVDQNTLSLNLIKFSCITGKTSATGYGTYSIQTSFLKTETTQFFNVRQLTITTSSYSAWSSFFENKIIPKLNCNATITPELDITGKTIGINIEFSTSNIEHQLPDITLKITTIDVQIVSGLVK